MLKLLTWDGKEDFDKEPRLIYITDSFKHAGYFKQISNFTWAIVSRAGHAAPGD